MVRVSEDEGKEGFSYLIVNKHKVTYKTTKQHQPEGHKFKVYTNVHGN